MFIFSGLLSILSNFGCLGFFAMFTLPYDALFNY